MVGATGQKQRVARGNRSTSTDGSGAEGDDETRVRGGVGGRRDQLPTETPPLARKYDHWLCIRSACPAVNWL